MKKTVLYDTHVELGAKMVEFGGFLMPVQYSSITEEHLAVRKAAGLFDVSHMGEFIVTGADAEAFLNSVTSNNVAKIAIGQAQYSCFPTPEGGIVDDLIIYRLDEAKYEGDGKAFMLVVNASNIEKDWNWLQEHKAGDVNMKNISDQTALFALQGPHADEILRELTDTDIGAIKFYHFTYGKVAGIENVLISGTGYTGSGGYELYLDNDGAQELWDALMEAGKDRGLLPAGLGARDTLRLEMGFCLYGHEINDETSTLEAGLGWITKFKKGDFLGKDYLKKQKKKGVERKLIGFTLDTRRVPRQGYPIVNAAGEEVGVVTSGTQSPCLEQPIGMGYVQTDAMKDDLSVQVRKKVFPLERVKLPFYKG